MIGETLLGAFGGAMDARHRLRIAPLAERLKTAIERKDAAISVFFAPLSLRAGGAWTAQLAEELAEADAFILLLGEAGVGKWQVPEYDEALDRWVKSGRTSRSSSSCSRGKPRPDCRFCANYTGSSRPIRRPRRTSRGSSTERPAAARARPSYGATLRPTAASKRWKSKQRARHPVLEHLLELVPGPGRLLSHLGQPLIGGETSRLRRPALRTS
jgi:hypothetical protein